MWRRAGVRWGASMRSNLSRRTSDPEGSRGIPEAIGVVLQHARRRPARVAAPVDQPSPARQGAASRSAKRPLAVRYPSGLPRHAGRAGAEKELPILSPCSITNPRHPLREPDHSIYLMRAIIQRLPGAVDVAESVPPAAGPRSETKKLPPATCVKFSVSPLPARTLAAAFQP